MIDTIDMQMLEWIGELLPDAEATLAAPFGGKRCDEVIAHCHLLGIEAMPAARSTDPRQQPPQQVALRYLVLVRASAPEIEHRDFARLLFAAMDRESWQVEFGPIPPAFWTATNLVPCPAMVLRVPARLDRPLRDVPLVRLPVVVRHQPARRLVGHVLGAQGVPVARARVEIPALRLETSTDASGAFAFATVPAKPLDLLVSARGRCIAVAASAKTDPLTIDFPITET